MTGAGRLDATVLIATHNRAALLAETLESLARMRVPEGFTWETLVIDNNSTDQTRAVVTRAAGRFPVPLRYLFESQPGRSSALNAGMAAALGNVFAFTDDDVRVSERWLECAAAPLRTSGGHGNAIGYTGGPVRPIWEAPPPPWLDLTRGDLWGTIAIQDHGDQPFEYEALRKVPLGANMAVARSVFDKVGGFRRDLGRSSGSRFVLGQEVPELLHRVRAAGYRGMYLPGMELQHHVPAKRLTTAYFRKWWFGKGISRAALDRLQPVTELGLDLRSIPHLFGVPRFMYGSAARDLLALCHDKVAGEPRIAFRREMMLAYFWGYVVGRWMGAKTAGSQRRRGRWEPGASAIISPRKW